MTREWEEEIGVGVVRMPAPAFGIWSARRQPRRAMEFEARRKRIYAYGRRAAGESYAAIARDMGVTVERVRQLAAEELTGDINGASQLHHLGPVRQPRG